MPKLTRLALDWLDLLVLLLLSYTVAGLLALLELRLPMGAVGAILAPLALGALSIRGKLAPRRTRHVRKQLTLAGLIATGLMVGGAFAALFGARLLVEATRNAPSADGERAELAELVEARNATAPPEGLSVTQLEPGEVPAEDAGGLDDLLEAMRASHVERAEVDRAEMRLRELERQHARTAEDYAASAWMGLFGVLAIALGGFVDSRNRAR